MFRPFVTLAVVGLALAFAITPAAAQAPKPEEITSSVPALDAMHEVIMPMWHEAWPNKDYKALAGLVPAIETHVAAISKAELPGILREKAPQWKAGVATLTASAAAYKAAVASGNNETLMKAAEKLHMDYEGLVRVVRPVLKEMDEFHGALYTLYHYQLNPFQLARVTESAQALKVKMEALNKAVLPERLKAKNEAFVASRAALAKAVDAVAAELGTKDEARIKSAIEAMHGAYENLEGIFQ
jgi:hypothetical protein